MSWVYHQGMAQKKSKAARRAEPSAQMIANLANVSLPLVYRKLAQGKSAREIIGEAIDRQRQTQVEPPDLPLNGHAGNGALSYAQAQAAKETALAELNRLKVMEKQRLLMPVSYFRIWAMRFLVEGKDILLNGPGELRDQLAAESDPIHVEQILRAWVERALMRCWKLETLWNGQEPLSEAELRERFEAARLSVVKGSASG